MVEVAASVSGVTADQVRGIRQATGSMETTFEQVRGIAESESGLKLSVEESSSSILELGAAGERADRTPPPCSRSAVKGEGVSARSSR